MRKVGIEDGERYDAPGHFDMRALRLHSVGTSNAKNFTLGTSILLPGGGTEFVTPPVELIYFILEGELTVRSQTETIKLGKWDSIHFDAFEGKEIRNETNRPTTMLVVAAIPPKT